MSEHESPRALAERLLEAAERWEQTPMCLCTPDDEGPTVHRLGCAFEAAEIAYDTMTAPAAIAALARWTLGLEAALRAIGDNAAAWHDTQTEMHPAYRELFAWVRDAATVALTDAAPEEESHA